MVLLAVQDGSAGGPLTFQAATSGGDQIPQGSALGGWQRPHVLVLRTGATACTATVAGMAAVVVAINTAAVLPVNGASTFEGGQAKLRAISYSQVVGVTVAAARMAAL